VLGDQESLPSYRGELERAERAPVESVMNRIRKERPHATKPFLMRRIDPLSVVAAAIVGLVLGLLLASPKAPSVQPLAYQQNVAAPNPTPIGLAMLSNLDLVQACQTRPTDAVNSTDAANSTDRAVPTEASSSAAVFSCCTRCHRFSQEHIDAPSRVPKMARLLRGCSACHEV
jgi:hypothetical protein